MLRLQSALLSDDAAFVPSRTKSSNGGQIWCFHICSSDPPRPSATTTQRCRAHFTTGCWLQLFRQMVCANVAIVRPVRFATHRTGEKLVSDQSPLRAASCPILLQQPSCEAMTAKGSALPFSAGGVDRRIEPLAAPCSPRFFENFSSFSAP